MKFYGTCENLSADFVQDTENRGRKVDYKKLVRRIKKENVEIYRHLSLDIYNPFWSQSYQTKEFWVLVHSAINFFFFKDGYEEIEFE